MSAPAAPLERRGAGASAGNASGAAARGDEKRGISSVADDDCRNSIM
jgi:hypothetical protein